MKSKGGAANETIKALSRLQVICGRTGQRSHTDGAREQNTKEVKDFLSKQGTEQTFTAPNSSSSNATVERRFERIFAAARTALNAAASPLNSKEYWSFAAPDAIDISNYMPFKRDGMIQPAPQTTMQLHVWKTEVLGGPNGFLPYRQTGFIVDTMKKSSRPGELSPMLV